MKVIHHAPASEDQGVFTAMAIKCGYHSGGRLASGDAAKVTCKLCLGTHRPRGRRPGGGRPLPPDVAAIYETMATPLLINLRHAFQLDAQHLHERSASRAFCRGRLAIIDHILERRSGR